MRYHAKTAMKRNSTYDIALDELENCLSAKRSLEDEFEEKYLIDAIENFLDSLSQENRVIFMRRYWLCDSYDDIARCVGITEKNVSVRLTRIRKQLRNYLKQKGVLV